MLKLQKVVNRAYYSTKQLNVVFFGSDSVSNPTLQLLYSDFIREDGLINKLEVSLKKAVDGYRLSVLRIRKTNIVTN